MSDIKKTSCRLCLKYITDESFEVIDDVIRDILDGLLLNLKIDSGSKEVICNVCRRKLNAASEFKSTCLNTDNTIMLYADSEKALQLDLREVYMQEKKSGLVCSQKICRLCLHPVEREFRCIREEELEAIEKLAPEMIISIVKDPVACKPCLDSLCTHNSFLKDCLEVEEQINNTFESSAAKHPIDTSPLDLFIKTENLDKEFNINEMKMSIKAESIDIKSEDERSDTLLQNSHIVPFEESDCKDECIYETESEICLTINENDLEAYKCESYECETENNKLLHRQMLGHKDPSQNQMYRCNDCDFKTKYTQNIKRHQLKHKDPSQEQMYKCNDCDYKTIYKRYIKQHQLKHKDPSQVQMYRCKDCDYETKFRSYIIRHQLKHKDPSQVQMYKCSKCNYETKYKNGIKQHQLKHRDPSPVQTYKCNYCDYETNYKSGIGCHMLMHKESSTEH
ncbi:zinc finger protein 701-like [Anoplophora glabripennis]|uniref:zinc finger protein 701-like n=1 Tax=Anoplophora glabripennis TaxID=217634 RepID=UPI000873D512|nr:zinc finger protein 701-like [Anoplophora glabripennis]